MPAEVRGQVRPEVLPEWLSGAFDGEEATPEERRWFATHEMCLARDLNERRRLALLNFLRRPCKLVNVLQDNLVGHTVMEFVLGDGLSVCCQRGKCHRAWFKRGWVCPMFFYRSELLMQLNAQHGSRYCFPDWQDQLRLLLAAWTS